MILEELIMVEMPTNCNLCRTLFNTQAPCTASCDIFLCVNDPLLDIFYWAGFMNVARDELDRMTKECVVE